MKLFLLAVTALVAISDGKSGTSAPPAEIDGFYEALCQPLLSKNADVYPQALDNLMTKCDDSMEFCRGVKSGNNRCENKDTFKAHISAQKGAFKHCAYKVTKSDLMLFPKPHISVQCELTLEDKEGCKITFTNLDDFYFGTNDKVTKYESRGQGQTKQCPEAETAEATKVKVVQKAASSKHYKPVPETTAVGTKVNIKTKRESILKRFFGLSLECGLKAFSKDQIDMVLEKVMDLLDDGATYCFDGGLKCKNGKDGIRQFMVDEHDGKYDRVEPVTSPVFQWNANGNMVTVCYDVKYKNGDICVRSTEKYDVAFNGDKIKYIDGKIEGKPCISREYEEPKDSKPRTTERMNDDPRTKKEAEHGVNYKKSESAEAQRSSRTKRLVSMEGDFEKNKKIEGFYKKMVECSDNWDDLKIEELCDYLSDSASFCLDARCYDKDGVRKLLKEKKRGNAVMERVEYAVSIKSNEGNKVEFECKLSVKNKENGCIVTVYNDGKCEFDDDGKIKYFEDKYVGSIQDEKSCGN